VHDGISFEQLGKPALVICTRPFTPTSRATVSTLGIRDYSVAFVVHPIGSRRLEEIPERAEDAYRQGLPILLGFAAVEAAG
jgi:hypothetical protein